MDYTVFDLKGFSDYKSWLKNDKKILKTINELIISIQRHGPLDGYGKPEVLRGNYKGCYSRRIDEKNRLIYQYSKKDGDSETIVLGCCDHYSGKENTIKQSLMDKFNI